MTRNAGDFTWWRNKGEGWGFLFGYKTNTDAEEIIYGVRSEGHDDQIAEQAWAIVKGLAKEP